MHIYKAVLFFFFAVTLGISKLNAQKTLPDITVNTEKGYNIISWINPYKSGIKAIVVERSVDSHTNFAVIGMVKDISSSIQSFVDVTPLAGDNYYRVNVIFQSDIDWKSNVEKITLDSLTIANRKQIASEEALQKKVNEVINEKGNVENGIVTQNIKQVELPKSKYIFTNPFSGNINIELPDSKEYNYFITFYTQNDVKVFDIPRIHEDEIILDKRNFQNIGTYKFIIKRDDKEFEKGYIVIY